jgi:AmiR/NasT family two-component response regulator
MTSTSIPTFVVGDHPAMRAGVATVLDQEEDIAVVGAATGGRQLWRMLGAADPDVVLMDFDLDGEDGVILCHRPDPLVHGLLDYLGDRRHRYSSDVRAEPPVQQHRP